MGRASLQSGRAVERGDPECRVGQRRNGQLPTHAEVFTVVKITQEKNQKDSVSICSSLKPTISLFRRFNWVTVFITVTQFLSLS